MSAIPRVAFLTDSYHEVNGVALTSRRFQEYAVKKDRPFLCVRAGDSTRCGKEGGIETLDLKRGPISFGIDRRQRHDLALWRYRDLLRRTFCSFKPDIVHITGPSDIGQLGALVAHLMRIPLVASWHTDLHKYAAYRLRKSLSLIPRNLSRAIGDLAERRCLDALVRFYQIPRAILAPNEEIIELLADRTRKPVYIMRRGVDTELFTPAKRDHYCGEFTLGYVGRLTPEKNVRLLAEVGRALEAAGRTNYRFLIVGDGYERTWLERNIKRAEFTGFLAGEALAKAYANMDLFLFPSRTDTFGNVVLEALSSGTPAVVTADGGPKYLVTPGVTGVVAPDDAQFVAAVRELMDGGRLHQVMRQQARKHACSTSWDQVFDSVYRVYVGCLGESPKMELSRAYALRWSCQEPMPNDRASKSSASPLVSAVFLDMLRDPGTLLWKRWNWKSALLSSLTRGSIFFSVNLFASWKAATSALVTELVFRPFMSGFYGTVTEQFSPAQPTWAATLVVIAVLPAINHVVELAIHWARGTQKLGASVLASIVFSVLSGLFNIFAMRRGVLIVGEGRRSLLEDLRRVPLVLAAFLTVIPRSALAFALAQRTRANEGSPRD